MGEGEEEQVMGRVCAKHQEFYENECRWCETPPVAAKLEPGMTIQKMACLNQDADQYVVSMGSGEQKVSVVFLVTGLEMLQNLPAPVADLIDARSRAAKQKCRELFAQRITV